ncbi:MAG: SDR family oxidoreductase [Betaproteobacteria bacterium]|nr:SDR family oxidoreductase [Pseudomonadota bacterium]NBO12050.1 SDR family oxidoreductase [Betaproteobacteria bacterium]NBO45037.1 SDR family oxidoreductase [Betaproteobacteria bacterium]NBP09972.1 SDR family oxidoreductase [Betaproteobacteria bacterium]NBP60721.1 SDR family oxidoreductase [Betaproteobacteria bacterium]
MHQGRVRGKKILITAAGQGMGAASALALLREGASVIATDIRSDLLQELERSFEATVLKHPEARLQTQALDVTDAEAIRALMTPLDDLDVLFNCAGYVHQGSIEQCDEAQWDHSFNLNVRSMFRLIQASLPAMLARGQGSIINMASVCSSLKGLPNRFVYGTTKAAVIGLTKSVAADFVARGIRCNAIAPGTVETPSLHERMLALGDMQEARRMFTSRQPMGRLAQPDDIVPIVLYLASDESAFATGQVFAIDGGMTI